MAIFVVLNKSGLDAVTHFNNNTSEIINNARGPIDFVFAWTCRCRWMDDCMMASAVASFLLLILIELRYLDMLKRRFFKPSRISNSFHEPCRQ
jgi:hypothetical protein